MSTGPRTPAGKKNVSRNALKHGLRATKWMSEEEESDYHAILTALAQEHDPQTPTEELTIERIAMGMTKLRRLQRVEDAMYAKARWEIRNPIADFPSRRAPMAEDAVIPPIKLLDSLARYQTTLERQISKAIGELLVLKDRRMAHLTPPPVAPVPSGVTG